MIKAVLISSLILLSLGLKAHAQTVFVNLSDMPVYVTQERFIPVSAQPYYVSDQYCYSGWWTVEPLGGTLTMDSSQAYYVEQYFEDEDSVKPVTWSRTNSVGLGLIRRDARFEDVCLSTENFRDELRDSLRQHSDYRDVEYHEFGDTIYPIGDALNIEVQACHFNFSSYASVRHNDACNAPGKIVYYQRTALDSRRANDVSVQVVDETTLDVSVTTDGTLADPLNDAASGYYQASFDVYYVVSR